MASFATTRPNTAFFGVNTTYFVKTAMTAFTAWNDQRITRKSLSKLSARELEDIGLSYCDIEGIAKRVSR